MLINYNINWNKIKPPKNPVYPIIDRYVNLEIAEDGSKAQAIWTNGYVLVAIPVTPEPDDAPGPVPIDVLIEARKAATRNKDYRVRVGLDEVSYLVHDNVVSLPRRGDEIEGLDYPKYEAVIPKEKAPQGKPAMFDMGWMELITGIFGRVEAGGGTKRGTSTGKVALYVVPTGDVEPLRLSSTPGGVVFGTPWAIVMPQYAYGSME